MLIQAAILARSGGDCWRSGTDERGSQDTECGCPVFVGHSQGSGRTEAAQGAQTGAAHPRERAGPALDDLATRPFGPWLLGVTALGLVAYGLFLLAEARFHRVAVT